MARKRGAKDKTSKPITCSRCPDEKAFTDASQLRAHQNYCTPKSTLTLLGGTQVTIERDPATMTFRCPSQGCSTTDRLAVGIKRCLEKHALAASAEPLVTPQGTHTPQANATTDATSDEEPNLFEQSTDSTHVGRAKRTRMDDEEEISKEQEQQEGHEQVNRTRRSHPSFFLVLSFNVHDGFLTVFLNRDATTTGKSLFSKNAPRRKDKLPGSNKGPS